MHAKVMSHHGKLVCVIWVLSSQIFEKGNFKLIFLERKRFKVSAFVIMPFVIYDTPKALKNFLTGAVLSNLNWWQALVFEEMGKQGYP